jgi:hypothetical protein
VTTIQLGNLYPVDPYQPAGESLYVPTGAPDSESLYNPALSGDRFTSVFTPPAAPAPRGVYDSVTWIQNGTTPMRFLDGMSIRQFNVGLESQIGVWGGEWCGEPGVDDKTKTRPDAVLGDIAPITVYAWDQNQCGDLTQTSRDEVRARAQQAMTLGEQRAVEVTLAERLLNDAAATQTVDSLTEAVSILESHLARAGVTGYLHASPKWSAYLAAEGRLSNGGTSPMGHKWVFGGGYLYGLGDTIVATTDLFGWRGPLAVRDSIKPDTNQYVVLVERSLLIAYEAAVAAVTVTIP